MRIYSTIMQNINVARVNAFTRNGAGGNAAGVCCLDSPMEPNLMQSIAAVVGYSETAFYSPASDDQPASTYTIMF